MINLIKADKGISIIIFLFIMICLPSAGQAVDVAEKKLVFYVIFASGFSGESADIYINGKEVMKNACLKSDNSDGVTSCWVRIFNVEDACYAETASKNKEFIKLPSCDGKFEMHIAYKGMLIEFELSKSKGKYIVIRGNGKPMLELVQSTTAPMFD